MWCLVTTRGSRAADIADVHGPPNSGPEFAIHGQLLSRLSAARCSAATIELPGPRNAPSKPAHRFGRQPWLAVSRDLRAGKRCERVTARDGA